MREFLIIGSGVLARQVAEIVNYSYKHYTVVTANSIEDIDNSIKEGIVAIEDNLQREQAVKQLLEKIPEFQFKYIINPFAYIGDGVKIGPGTIVLAGAIINCGVQLFDCCIVGCGVIIEPDIKVGSYATIDSGSVIYKDLPNFEIVTTGRLKFNE